jgi:hypothetical protein
MENMNKEQMENMNKEQMEIKDLVLHNLVQMHWAVVDDSYIYRIQSTFCKECGNYKRIVHNIRIMRNCGFSNSLFCSCS